MKINYSSVEKIIGNSNQALIYGSSDCKSDSLKRTLDLNSKSPVAKVYNYTIGTESKGKNSTTLEGRIMEKIPLKKANFYLEQVRRESKAALVNLTLENYKRKKENLPLVKIIFSFDIDQNPHPSSSTTITSRKTKFNSRITNAELRRLYTITHEIEDIELKEIARESLVFVKLTKDEKQQYQLMEVAPFWKKQDWNEKWKQRKDTKKNSTKDPKYDWKTQLITKKNQYLKNSKK